MDDNFYPPSAPLGSQLRALRRAGGWSLAEAARRAGTSAPALHRYESGWDRFELRTLRRLAAALDARLEVRLVPTGSPAGGRRRLPSDRAPSARELVKRLAPLFWDRDLAAADLEEYREWVIRRVIMFGGMEEVALLRRFYGDGAVQRAARHRSVDRRTRNFWRLLEEAG